MKKQEEKQDDYYVDYSKGINNGSSALFLLSLPVIFITVMTVLRLLGIL